MRWSVAFLLSLLAFPLFCPAHPQSASPQVQTPKPPKKVWTNTDLETLREKLEVSDRTQAVAAPETATAQQPVEIAPPAETSAKERDPKWYARQELPLQRELAEIAARLNRFRDFRKSGKGATGGVALLQENTAITPEDAIKILTKRKAEIQQMIGGLEDQARRNRISSGQIVSASREVEAEETIAAQHPEAAQEAARIEQEEESAALQLAEKIERERNPEAYWRKRFAYAYARLRLAERELSVLQREWNVGLKQYYDDPNKALRQQYTRQDVNFRTLAIRQERDEVNRLRQELSNLEDELRHSGGQPGWARSD